MQKIILLHSSALKLFLAIVALLIADSMYAQMTNFGNLYINATGSVSVNGSFVNTGSSTDLKNSGNLQLTGDFTNNGNDLNAAGTGMVIFNGAADQNINGIQSSTFYNVSKPNSNNIIIANNETVSNTLTLTDGTFNLNNHNLTLNGAFSGMGTLTGSATSGLFIGGNAGTLKFTQTATGNYLDTLTLNTSGSATLGNALNITAGTNFGTVTANTGSALNANGYLTLRSDAGGTSRVAESYGTISGTTTVERYIPANRAWRLLTSPLTGTGSIYNTWQNGGVYEAAKGLLVTGPNPLPSSNGLDVSQQNNSSMSEWNTATQKLVNMANTRDTTLSYNKSASADNKGYFIFVRGDRDPANTIIPNTNITTLSSSGKLQLGAQTFACGGSVGNYTLIGNPYASTVDFNKVTRANLVKRLYFYDPTLNEVGGYVMLDDLNNDGVFVKSVTISKQDENIQSSEAFFVETMTTAPASLTFNESDKSAMNNELVFRPGNMEAGMLRANLYFADSTNKMIDGTFAQFNNSFSADITYEDALKFGNVNETFSMERKGIALTAERMPELNVNDTLFYKLTKASARDYRIEFVADGINHSTVEGFVEDTYLNTKTPVNLDGTTAINFSIIKGDAASAASNRFRIVFKPALNPLPVTFTTIKATRQNQNINVEWKTENELNIKQYEVEKSNDGITFSKVATVAASGNTTYNWLDKDAFSSVIYYRIKSIDISGDTKYSSIAKVNVVNIEASEITVYPNPVVNSKIGLQMNNMPSGKYNCKLINALGQVIFTTTLNHSSANTRETISPNQKIAKGIYKLEIIGSDKKSKVLNVLVE